MTNAVARYWNNVAFGLLMVAVAAGTIRWEYIVAFTGPMAIGIWVRLLFEARNKL